MGNIIVKVEKTDWKHKVSEHADDIMEENVEGIDKIIDKNFNIFKKDEKEGRKKVEETDDEKENRIYDLIEREFDFVDICHEATDNLFIYTDSSSIIDYIYCIDELSEFEETDHGLWDGEQEVRDIIRTKAFFTFRNALGDKVEEYVRGRIFWKEGEI
jgi:hypothetical protein